MGLFMASQIPFFWNFYTSPALREHGKRGGGKAFKVLNPRRAGGRIRRF
jgi:hypothetical protein